MQSQLHTKVLLFCFNWFFEEFETMNNEFINSKNQKI
jgi:hypothetical protein